jgi:hypothetical protein
MAYRISYIGSSTNEHPTEGSPRTEEFPTEPAALARARELLEDPACNLVFVSRNSGASQEDRLNPWQQPLPPRQ